MILTCPECSTRYLLSDEDHIGSAGRTVRCSKCQTSWFVSSDLDELMLKDNENTEILKQVPPVPKDSQYYSDGAQASHSRLSDTHNSMNSTPPALRDIEHVQRGSFGNSDNTDPKTEPVIEPVKGRGVHVEIRDQKDRRRRNFRLAIVGLIWGITLGLLGLAAIFAYLNRQNMIDRFPQSATLYRAFGIEVYTQGLAFDKPVTRSTFIDGDPVLVINGSVKNISTRTMPLPMVVLSLNNGAQELLVEWRVEFQERELAKGARAEFIAHFPNPPIDAKYLQYRFDDGETRTQSSVNVFEPVEDKLPLDVETGAVRENIPVPTPALSKEEADSRREVEPIPMIVEE